MSPLKDRPGVGPAFLLAQLGAHAAARFAERLAPLKLAPPDAGILHILRSSPGISQQELAGRLGAHPSRLVALIDGLEQRGLVERRPNPEDRRLYSLFLSAQGTASLEDIGRVGREHQEDLLRSLDREERQQLTVLLQKIAESQGLTPGVHPGFRMQRPC
ncbi:MAG TPA: MarR family transcriptional regulator [Candidatus Sulfotelmatobacter sp.]|nr:MarR family transcriptional regulator [Candidatus Sulfotelmatobacter sp.]